MADVDQPQLRLAIFEWLRTHPEGQLSFEHQGPLWKFLSEKKLGLGHPDMKPVVVVLADLIREGIVVPGVTNATWNDAWTLPRYFVSPHGEKVLANREYEPHDPEGYLDRVRKEVPGLDAVIETYLMEALGCYRHGFNLAAAVMVGAASEKALLNLIETMARGLKDQAFDKAINRAQTIKQKQEVMTQFLPDPKTLPVELAERLPQAVEFVFHALRITRNDAGHPTGRFVQPGVVHGNLVLFPTYLRTLKDLDAHFP